MGYVLRFNPPWDWLVDWLFGPLLFGGSKPSPPPPPPAPVSQPTPADTSVITAGQAVGKAGKAGAASTILTGGEAPGTLSPPETKKRNLGE